MSPDEASIKLTIAIPTLNEERYIGRALASLVDQIDTREAEIFVLDGGSVDSTCQIVSDFAERFPSIRLVHNPRRLQSAALNLAASLANPSSRILVRADAHAVYPANFVRACVESLQQSGAASTVVPMLTVGETCFQRAVAAAQNSVLGNGGARHRVQGRSGFVDHGHHAVFDICTFRAVGGYDEAFSHNEDAELDHRLVASGYKIYLCADVPVNYFPRDRATALARQYFNHGRGRACTLLRHSTRPKLRQLLPPAALVGSVAGTLLATIEPAFIVFPIGYAALCNGIGLTRAVRERDRCLTVLGLAAMIMHFSWSLGFLRTLAAHGWGWVRELVDTGAVPRREAVGPAPLERTSRMREQAR